METMDFAARRRDLILWDVDKEPAVAEKRASLRKAQNASSLAQDDVLTAKRSRSASKSTLLEKATTIADALNEAEGRAAEEYEETKRPLVIAHNVEEERFLCDLVAAFLGEGTLFLNAYQTGETKHDYYGDHPVYRGALEPEPCLTPGVGFTRSAEQGDIRIRLGDFRRGEFSFDVQLLGNETYEGEPGIRKERFGYHADVRYWDREVKVNWGSFSGMDTIQDARDMLFVHSAAVEFGQFLAKTFGEKENAK